MKVSLFFLAFLLASIKTSNAVSDVGCGQTKACFKFPQNCLLTDSSCLFFSYVWNQSTGMFAMELRGGAGNGATYTAVAFSATNRMQDADMYYCTGTSLKSGAIQGLYQMPVTDTETDVLTMGIASTSNGVAECQFTRYESVTKTISGDTSKVFNLTADDFYVLLASSAYPDVMTYHGTQRWISSSAVNLRSSSPQTSTATFIPPTTTLSPTITSGCNTTKRCYTNTPGCSPGDTNCIFFSWKYNPNSGTFDMEISGKPELDMGYIAIAFAPTGNMENADVYFCASGVLGSATIGQQYSSPVVDSVLPTGVLSTDGDSTNGMTTCKFTRPSSVTRTASDGSQTIFDLSSAEFHLLSAIGLYPGGNLQYHFNLRWFSPSSLNYTTGFLAPPPQNETRTSTTPLLASAISTTPGDECGTTKLCVSNIPNCSTTSSGCVTLSSRYVAEVNNFEMEISVGALSDTEYVAIAFASSPTMQDADLYYCTASNLGSGTIQSLYVSPILDATLPAGVVSNGVVSTNGKVTCSFTRPVSITITDQTGQPKSFDLLAESFHVLFAIGSYAGGTLLYHQQQRWSSPPVNFMNGFSTTPTAATTISEVVSTTTTIVSTTKTMTTAMPTSSATTPPKCGGYAECMSNIPNCTVNQPNCIILSWNYDKVGETFDMQIRGNIGVMPKYVAVAMSTSTQMQDADLYFCTRGALKSGVIRGRYSNPIEDSTLPVGISMPSAATNNEVIQCRFRRARSLTKTISQNKAVAFDLVSNSYHVLFASGAYLGNSMLYHGVDRWSSNLTKFVSVESVTANTASPTPTPSSPSSFSTQVIPSSNPTNSNAMTSTLTAEMESTSSTPVSSLSTRSSSSTYPLISTTVNTEVAVSQSFSPTSAPATPGQTLSTEKNRNAQSSASTSVPDAEGCGKTKGCFRFPPGCQTGDSSCILTTWVHQAAEDKFKFEIIGATSGEYVATALSSDGMMRNADMYYCTETELKSGVIRGLYKPPVDDNDMSVLTDVEVKAADGVLKCSFSRPASVDKLIDPQNPTTFDVITSNYYILMAAGATLPGNIMQYHQNRRSYSDLPVNFTRIRESVQSSGGSSARRVLIKLHASLMIIAWITCVSIGVLIARHFKPLWHGSTCFGTKVWFQIHRAMMSTAVVSTLVAFVLIFVYAGGYSANAGAHPIIGLIVTGLAITNPLMALFRPHPNSPKRYIFNWGHWFVGLAARTLSVVAIFLGIDLPIFNLHQWVTWLMIGFVVFHIITEIVMEIISARYGHIEAYKKPNKTSSVEMTKPAAGAAPESDNNKPMPPKGAKIKYIVLGIYATGNIAFLIAFIVAIAMH